MGMADLQSNQERNALTPESHSNVVFPEDGSDLQYSNYYLIFSQDPSSTLIMSNVHMPLRSLICIPFWEFLSKCKYGNSRVIDSDKAYDLRRLAMAAGFGPAFDVAVDNQLMVLKGQEIEVLTKFCEFESPSGAFSCI